MNTIDRINNKLKEYLENNQNIKRVDNISYNFNIFLNKLKIPDDLPAIYYNFNLDTVNNIEYKPSFSTRETLIFKLYVVDNYSDFNTIDLYINYILSFPNYINRECNVIVDKYTITNKHENISEQEQIRIIQFSIKVYHYNQYIRGV